MIVNTITTTRRLQAVAKFRGQGENDLWYGRGVESGRGRMAAPLGENVWPLGGRRSVRWGRLLPRLVGKTIRSNEMLTREGRKMSGEPTRKG